jgi:RHS repeat-associated protein
MTKGAFACGRPREDGNKGTTCCPGFWRIWPPAVLLTLALLTWPHVTIAQDYVMANQASFPTAPEAGDLGYVDTSNGDLHIEIPLGSFPQRGSSTPLQLKIVYDSAFWIPNSSYLEWTDTGVPPGAATTGGWHEMIPGPTLYAISYTMHSSGSCTQFVNFSYEEARGSGITHYFPISIYDYGTCSPKNLSGSAYATDSSGYFMSVSNDGALIQVYAPDGTLADSMTNLVGSSMCNTSNICQGPEDSNGNFIQTNTNSPWTLIDNLGRPLVVESNASSTGTTCPSGDECYDVLNSKGTTSRYTAQIATIYASTKFSQSGYSECTGTECPLVVIESLTLPDGSQYSFKYDCDPGTGSSPICGSAHGLPAYYGELLSVTLPTGGALTYGYTNFKDSYGNEHRWLTSRTGAGGGAWAYQPHVVSTCTATTYNCKQTVTVSNPNGSNEVTTYNWDNGTWPTLIQEYAGSVSSGNLVSTVTNNFYSSITCPLINCYGYSYFLLGSSQQTIVSTGGASITKQTSYNYDSPQTANIIAKQEWGYYAGASPSFPSIPDRATYYTYAMIGGTNNINRPATITTCSNSGSSSYCLGGGAMVAQRTITYDGSSLTSITGVANHDDTNFGISNTSRGNPTEFSDWVSSTLSPLNSYSTYDTTGQVLSATDPAGNSTTFSYADNFFDDIGNTSNPSAYGTITPTNAYVKTITLPIIGAETFGYYYGDGKEALYTDQNNDTTIFHFYDPDDRPTATVYPSGWNLTNYTSSTQVDYYDDVADSTLPSSGCTYCRHFEDTSDSWGRGTAVKVLNSPVCTTIEVDKSYDSWERLYQESHPYCSGPVYETYSYVGNDPFNRLYLRTHPDGSSFESLYGNGLTATQYCSSSTYGLGYPAKSLDENGKARITWQDGLGRTIETDEPDGGGGFSQDTCYKYDVLDDLIEVDQGSLPARTFRYDGLRRLTQETTPEAGTVSLYYINLTSTMLCSGDPSNVCNKVAPTPNQTSSSVTTTTTYCYDALGRITGKGYSSQSCPMSSATVSYTYDQGGAGADAVGRLSYMSDPSGSETYTYDTTHRMGWLAQLQKVVGSTNYTTSYAYDASGDVTQITYPSGRVVQRSYSVVGQLCAVATSTTACGTATGDYATGYNYDAAGQIVGMEYGNGVYGSFGYSANRSQMNCLDYSTTNRSSCAHDTTSLFGLNYYFQYDSTNCPTGTSANNGQIDCVNDLSAPASAGYAGRSAAYTYDTLGRLIGATTAGSSSYPAWGISETYDRYGNRWTQAVTTGSGPSASLSYNTSNQPMASPVNYAYDAAGNMIVEPLSPPNNYTFDYENRLTGYSGNSGAATYSYDDNNKRVVESIAGGTTTVYIYSGDQVLAEYDNGAVPSSPSREYVYGDSQLLATIDSSGTNYYHQDHRDVRLMTNSVGAITWQQGSYPFGEQWYSGSLSNPWVFTTYQRDSESGLDYALARFYDSRVASFCSADPVQGRTEDPQTWNRYAYARNDPIDITDPSGQSWWSWLIGALSAALTMVLPEIDPALFAFLDGSSASENVATGFTFSDGISVDAATGNLMVASGYMSFGSAWGSAALVGGASTALTAGGKAPLDSKNLARFQSAQQQAEKNLDNKNCQSFLTQHGINPSDVKTAVQNEQPWNGLKSTITEFQAHTYDPLEGMNSSPAAIHEFVTTTIAQSFKNTTYGLQGAIAENGGPDVYFRPGSILSSGGITAINVVHEALHNLLGLGDHRLAEKLGLPSGSGSSDLNPALQAHGCAGTGG